MNRTGRLSLSVSMVVITLAGATAYAGAPGQTLGHTSLEMTRSDGARARLVFLSHSKVLFQGVKMIDVMEGHGTYTVSARKFCYATDFPGKECWKLSSPLRVDEAVKATSTDGSTSATLTLRRGGQAVMPKSGA